MGYEVGMGPIGSLGRSARLQQELTGADAAPQAKNTFIYVCLFCSLWWDEVECMHCR